MEWAGSHTPCILDLLMDSKELSSISDCFGDKKAIKTPKLNIIWLELIARVLNMPIRLKGNNYYSKVFKRVNYQLWNSTFWVVINYPSSHIIYASLSLLCSFWVFGILFVAYVWVLLVGYVWISKVVWWLLNLEIIPTVTFDFFVSFVSIFKNHVPFSVLTSLLVSPFALKAH